MSDGIGRMVGITEVHLSSAQKRRAFFFEPHRLALPCWALENGHRSTVLLTFDRHFDLVPPLHRPSNALRGEALYEFAREKLSVRNYDHILAAIDCGVIDHVVAVARAWPQGAYRERTVEDAQQGQHQLVHLTDLDDVSGCFEAERSLPESMLVKTLIEQADNVIVDIDLDCFTSPSDVNPTVVIPWTRELIRAHLQVDAKAMWSQILRKTRVITCALEPAHCGGLVASHQLFATFAQFFFESLLGVDVP
jgi:UPF0489 domain